MAETQRLSQNDLIARKNRIANYGSTNKNNTNRENPLPIATKSLQKTISENAILAALSVHDYRRIQPNLETVDLLPGKNLYNCGDGIRYVYFPINAVVYLFTTLKDGATIEHGVVGSEGMLGISAVLGEMTTPNQARVLSRTRALRIPAGFLKREFCTGGMFHQLMLRYIHNFYIQSSQTAACNRHHNLNQKLCRWLLMTDDRAKSDRLEVTQEFISQMLGMRRPYITAALGLLQKEGIIQNRRGYIEIIDRQALEESCCECYEIMK
jgi:CRP-like cAMP-binding protein